MLNLGDLISATCEAQEIRAHFIGRAADEFDPRTGLTRPYHEYEVVSIISCTDHKSPKCDIDYLQISIKYLGEDKNYEQ